MQKVSVLIIAHNEEKYIEKCILSIINQSLLADEIILIAHNCTDQTLHIASKFKQVKVVEFHGEVGITHARIKGFNEVSGDIVACIDGDAYAKRKWLAEITKPLDDPKISAVGGVVYYYGSILGWFGCVKYFYLKDIFDFLFQKYSQFYFFGPSFAVRREDYFKVGGLENFYKIKKEINLINNPDDCYFALALWQIGRVVLIRKKDTLVKAKFKHNSLYGLFIRPFEQTIDGIKLYKYFSRKSGKNF